MALYIAQNYPGSASNLSGVVTACLNELLSKKNRSLRFQRFWPPLGTPLPIPYCGKSEKSACPGKNRFYQNIFRILGKTNFFSPFDPIIWLLDLELVQIDTNFIKIGWEMAKIDRSKIDEISHFWQIFQPILTKLVSNSTNSRSRSQIMGSNGEKNFVFPKNRKIFW